MPLPWKQKEVMLAQSVLGEGWFFHLYLQAECLNILQVCVRPDTAVHTFNSNTGDAEAGGLRVRGQPGIYSKIFFLKIKGNIKPCGRFF